MKFAALNGQSPEQMVLSLKSNVIMIIKHFANSGQKKFIIQNLCIGLAYIIFHSHRIWPNLVDELIAELGQTPIEAQYLMIIMGYLASECEDEQIVIEESLRESFFDFIDLIVPFVMKNLFNLWAQRLLGERDKFE